MTNRPTCPTPQIADVAYLALEDENARLKHELQAALRERDEARNKLKMDEGAPEADLVARLLEACNGHPHAKIPWPHRLLHEAVDAIRKMHAEIADYQELFEASKDVLAKQREVAGTFADLQDYIKGCQELTGEKGILAVAIKRLRERAEQAERRLASVEAERNTAYMAVSDCDGLVPEHWWLRQHKEVIEKAEAHRKQWLTPAGNTTNT